MSLLIDALKQAEAARAQAQSESAPVDAAGSIELEPLPAEVAASPATPTEPSPKNIERTARRPIPPPARTSANEATRELFEVKRQPRNSWPLIIAGAGVVVLLIGAGYVWWAMQPRSSLVGPSLTTNNGTMPIASPTIQPLPNTPDTAMTQQVSSGSAQAVGPSAAEKEAIREVAPFSRRNPSGTRNTPQVAAANESVSETVEPQIRRSNATSMNIVSAPLQSAYDAYLAGNLTTAQQRYQEALRQEPRSVDAMNALGMIAWRTGHPDIAERWFRQVLQTDPTDDTAIAQLASLYADGDPASAEARLRSLIASQPSATAGHYALGNLMARQGRWSEAQQALFQAYTLDSGNPDTMFNLAVSLEHLRQAPVARQFYERALQAATRRPASFDKDAARARVQALGTP